ncbi:hypothetical protein [Modestobacter roseus]|uniref:Uncharacterized protein n=1 Tax=Modestobacter roseus TaxID=1181884 RepID=A0A562IL76_9ACTN|nr:hypothetical protein [Modestobacter roseus]MQA32274.1 hypothetical protein [Modestobacter roseus]TWH71769.1 hypothetical protein JD78_00267 [Modestobacter roseus]
MAATDSPATTRDATRRPHPIWSALVGLTSLGVLLQGLWAGLFLRPDADGSTWYTLHQRGAEITLTLAAIATIAAVRWLRRRRDLLIGTALLLVLLVAEYFLGRAGDAGLPLHVPLAMLLLGLAVWLPMAARRR